MGQQYLEKAFVTTRLLNYLYRYEKKGFEMNHVFIGIRNVLTKTGSISIGQFSVLIPFLEREKEFHGMDRGQLKSLFSPIVGHSARRNCDEYTGTLLGL